MTTLFRPVEWESSDTDPGFFHHYFLLLLPQANSIFVNSVAMKRKHSDSKADNQESLADLRAELTGASMGTESSIARVLSILKAKGQLTDEHVGRGR